MHPSAIYAVTTSHNPKLTEKEHFIGSGISKRPLTDLELQTKQTIKILSFRKAEDLCDKYHIDWQIALLAIYTRANQNKKRHREGKPPLSLKEVAQWYQDDHDHRQEHDPNY